MEYIKLTFSLPAGLNSTDSSLDNPLSRAIAPLLREGKPFPRISNVFFDLGSLEIKWLGVLIYSAGDRVLFFPGYQSPETNTRVIVRDKEIWNKPFLIDHVSLEKDQKSWHLTNPGSKDHIGKMPTRDLGQSRSLWFGMGVAGSNALRDVHKETIIQFEAPDKDAERRAGAFFNARDGVDFPLISLNSEYACVAEKSFLNFSFIVGPRGFPFYESHIGPSPDSPFVEKPAPEMPSQTPMRVYRVNLSPDLDLQITSSEIPGALTTKFTFYS